MAVNLEGIDLPALPGVYLFKTKEGRVLYVGKATRLADRIRSYFASTPDRAMIPELVSRADDVECIVTPSPSEALVLERQLIREHKPRFNSLLKDDKSFPYLVLTAEAQPRIMYTRHPPKGATKWGPFPNAGAAKQVMQLLDVKTTRRLANLRRQGLPAEQVSYVWHYDLELVLDWASMMGWEINPDGLKACKRALA